ncbi:cation-transporting P-type ATPase [Fluviicoccus sp.]|uniref:cation-transporting P-type ATPase n=1 Tax=Fluviicoccus sp. TaxID=2003552 RepID=UPI00351E16ED
MQTSIQTGLSAAEAARRLVHFGPNALHVKHGRADGAIRAFLPRSTRLCSGQSGGQNSALGRIPAPGPAGTGCGYRRVPAGLRWPGFWSGKPRTAAQTPGAANPHRAPGSAAVGPAGSRPVARRTAC